MKSHQIVVRNIPRAVHRTLKSKAEARGISVNAFVLEALELAAGHTRNVSHHDLDDLIGSWVADKAVDGALQALRVIDERDWK
jgi:hypothetical protein